MIVELKLRDKSEVQHVLDLQLMAYKVEAALIKFDGIPQLNDTVESIMTSKETFIGYKYEGELAGFISYEVKDNEIDFCRLVVRPNYFRKGIASKLLDYVVYENSGVKRFTVSTGSNNVPALTLYKRKDFTPYHEVEVAAGIYITLLEKSIQPKI